MYLLRTNQHIHILLRVLRWLKRTLMTRLSSFTLTFRPLHSSSPPFPVPVQIPCQVLNRADTFLLQDFCSWLFLVLFLFLLQRSASSLSCKPFSKCRRLNEAFSYYCVYLCSPGPSSPAALLCRFHGSHHFLIHYIVFFISYV